MHIRFLRSSVAAGSLLLGLATVVLWIRSYWIADDLWLTTNVWADAGTHVRQYALQLVRGQVLLTRVDRVRTQPLEEPRFVRTTHTGNLDEDAQELIDTPSFLGIGTRSYDIARLGSRGANDPDDRGRDVRVPLWLPTALFALPPLFWVRGIRRRTRGVRRARTGLCPRCGYDLRATRDRCPECGAAVDPGPRVAEGSWPRELVALPVGAAMLGVAVAAVSLLAMGWFDRQSIAWDIDLQARIATERARSAIAAGDADALARQFCRGAHFDPKEAGIEVRDAIVNGHPAVAALLVEEGANVTVGSFALPDALYAGYYSLALEIVRHGADPNARVAAHRAALHICADGIERPEQLRVVAALLNHGADPNLPDGAGDPPLHVIVTRWRDDGGWLQIAFARMLIEQGADLNRRNRAGATPLRLAVQGQEWLIAAFIRSRGGHE